MKAVAILGGVQGQRLRLSSPTCASIRRSCLPRCSKSGQRVTFGLIGHKARCWSSAAPNSVPDPPLTTSKYWIEEEDHSNSNQIVKRRYSIDAATESSNSASYRLESETQTNSEDKNNPSSSIGWRGVGQWRVSRIFSSYFLPVGFPASVRTPDYTGFYSWLFFQNVAGSTSYIMSMEALLHAVGVSSSALGWAAAASWVLKDGLGSIGMIFAAKILGDNNKFDADTLRAKWRADVAHNLGVSFELMTLVFPALFLPLASLANTLKGIAGLTNGACRASINRHLATQNNLGDVTAKGHAQGLAAYLTGLGLGVGLDSMIPALTSLFHVVAPGVDLPRVVALWTAFACLAVVHVTCSYMALRSIALRSMNIERSSILFDGYFTTCINDLSKLLFDGLYCHLPDAAFPTPLQLRDSKQEPIIQASRFKSILPAIHLGSSLMEAFPNASGLEEAIRCAPENARFLVSVVSGAVHVVFHRDVASDDILEAFFTSFALQTVLSHQGAQKQTSCVLKMSPFLQTLHDAFPRIRQHLSASQWNMNEILLVPNKLKSKVFWETAKTAQN